MDDFLIRRLLKLIGCLNAAIEEKQFALVFGGKSVKIKLSINEGTDSIVTVLVNGKTSPGKLGSLDYSGTTFPIVNYRDGDRQVTCLAVKIDSADGLVYTPLLSPEHARVLLSSGYRLAANGMLGGDVIEYGAKMSRLFDGVKVLWGEHADRVWALHAPKYAHSQKLAGAVLSCLRHGVKNPKSPTDARRKGAIFGFLSKDEWRGVVTLLEALDH